MQGNFYKEKSVLRGVLSYIPLLNKIKRGGTGGTDSGRYCYSVWLRHLSLLKEAGMKQIPDSLIEFGPGDSLGLCIAALLSGVNHVVAIDSIPFSSRENNLRITRELVDLFKKRAPLPADEEFPLVRPRLQDYRFPATVLPEPHMQVVITEERIAKVFALVEGRKVDGMTIDYIVSIPDELGNVRIPFAADLIISQAVMEHVSDIQDVYDHMAIWLHQDGFLSHQIDYTSHETHGLWNGHWLYSERMWRLIDHGRNITLSRNTHSDHIAAMTHAGFSIIDEKREENFTGVPFQLLRKKGLNISAEDSITESAHIIAVKRSSRLEV